MSRLNRCEQWRLRVAFWVIQRFVGRWSRRSQPCAFAYFIAPKLEVTD